MNTNCQISADISAMAIYLLTTNCLSSEISRATCEISQAISSGEISEKQEIYVKSSFAHLIPLLDKQSRYLTRSHLWFFFPIESEAESECCRVFSVMVFLVEQRMRFWGTAV